MVSGLQMVDFFAARCRRCELAQGLEIALNAKCVGVEFLRRLGILDENVIVNFLNLQIEVAAQRQKRALQIRFTDRLRRRLLLKVDQATTNAGAGSYEYQRHQSVDKQ